MSENNVFMLLSIVWCCNLSLFGVIRAARWIEHSSCFYATVSVFQHWILLGNFSELNLQKSREGSQIIRHSGQMLIYDVYSLSKICSKIISLNFIFKFHSNISSTPRHHQARNTWYLLVIVSFTKKLVWLHCRLWNS